MVVHLAPNWSDAQFEFYLQKICARFKIEYTSLRPGETPVIDYTGNEELDEAAAHIAGLIAALLMAAKNVNDLAAKNALAAKILLGQIEENVLIHRNVEQRDPD